MFDETDHNNVLKLLAFSYRLQTLKVIIRCDKYETPNLEWFWNILRFLFRQDKKFTIEITFDLTYDLQTRRIIEQALRTENITAVSLSVRDISKGDYWHGSNTFFYIDFCISVIDFGSEILTLFKGNWLKAFYQFPLSTKPNFIFTGNQLPSSTTIKSWIFSIRTSPKSPSTVQRASGESHGQ